MHLDYADIDTGHVPPSPGPRPVQNRKAIKRLAIVMLGQGHLVSLDEQLQKPNIFRKVQLPTTPDRKGITSTAGSTPNTLPDTSSRYTIL